MSKRKEAMRETLRAAIVFALTYFMVWGGIPAPALAEMAEEARSIEENIVQLDYLDQSQADLNENAEDEYDLSQDLVDIQQKETQLEKTEETSTEIELLDAQRLGEQDVEEMEEKDDKNEPVGDLPDDVLTVQGIYSDSLAGSYSVLLLDCSSSMSGTPRSKQEDAAKLFCSTILRENPYNKIAIVRISDTNSTSIICDFTNSITQLESTINSSYDYGSTNTGKALEIAKDLLQTIPSGITKNLIICSDGEPCVGATSEQGPYTSSDSSYDYAYANYAHNIAREIINDGSNVYSLGFFHSITNINRLKFCSKFMRGIQNSGYYDVDNPANLEEQFKIIAGNVLAEEDRYTSEHLAFANGETYKDTPYSYANRIQSNWAEEISKGLDTDTGIFGEQLHDFLTFIDNVVSFKVGDIFVSDNPYDAVIMELILLQGNHDEKKINLDYEERFKIETAKGVSDFVNDLEDICETFGKEEWKVTEYKPLLKKLFEDPVNVKENNRGFYDLCNRIFGKAANTSYFNNIVDKFGKADAIFKLYDNAEEIVECVYHCVNYNAAVSAYREVSEEFRQTLRDIYPLMTMLSYDPYDTKLLTRAKYAELFYKALNKYDGFQTEDNIKQIVYEAYKDGVPRILNGFNSVLRNDATAFAVNKLGLSTTNANAVTAVLLAYHFGFSASDWLTGNKANMDCRKRARALYYLEDALSFAVDNDAANLKSAQDYPHARKFDASYSILRNIEIMAIDNYIHYLNNQQTAPLYRAIFSPNFNEWEISIACLIKNEWQVAMCHGGNVDISSGSYAFFTVQCPTDVFVYDLSGEQVLAIENNVLTRDALGINGGTLGDGKFIIISEPWKYNVKVVATDAGTMDYRVSVFDSSNNNITNQWYTNVALEKGEEFDGSYVDETFNLISRGSTIAPSGSGSILPISSISIQDKQISLEKGETRQLAFSYLPSNASFPSFQWLSSNENVVQVQDGKLVAVGRGECAITCYAMDGSGASESITAYVNGWENLPNGGKGYRKRGKLVTGWLDLGSSKYYFGDDHAMLLGWNDVVVDGKTMHYYFNPASGNLVRGTWFTIDGYKYYFRPSGNVAHGWATIPDKGVEKKYYFDDEYHLVTGWRDLEVDGKILHYYFRPSGAMATGWATIDGRKFFFRPSGNMARGFADVPEDNFKRYFDSDGAMLTGWQTIDVKRYYFRPSGAMQTGTATIDGKTYRFSDKGVLVEEPTKGTPSISANNVSARMGFMTVLAPRVTPATLGLSFSSSNESVAKVSSTGLITPVHVGTATITISTKENDSWKSASKDITVTVAKGQRSLSVETSDMTTNPILLKSMSYGATPIRVKSSNGPIVYSKLSGSSALSVDASTGKVWVAKGSRAGAYTAQVKVTCQGDSDYEGVYTVETVYVHVDQSPEFGSGLKPYWVIFNEGFRDGRVEASAFDVASGTPYLWWARNSAGAKGLDVKGATLSGKVEQYYRNSSGWSAVSQYTRASDWASQIIATNVKVYDSNGDPVPRPKEIPAADFDGNPYWVMYVNANQRSRVELVTFDAASPVAARTTWSTSVKTLQAPKNGTANVYLLNAEGCWQRPTDSARIISGTALVQNASDVIAANVPAITIDGATVWKDLSSSKLPLFCW